MNEDTFNNDGIIAAIREYENSVEMPEDERMTCLDANNHVHLKTGDDKAPDYARYAEKCREYLRFGDEVDLATCGAYEPHDFLKICDTPQIFLNAGFEQKPMLYTQKHLRKALSPKTADDPHRHGLTIEQVKRLPQLFEAPVLFADNPSRDDAMLVVLCAVDNDKLPLITSVKPDGKGNYELEEIETNIVLTVFGKKNFARYFELALTPDMLLYLNKEKAKNLSAYPSANCSGTTQVLTLILLYASQNISSIAKQQFRMGTTFAQRLRLPAIPASNSLILKPTGRYRSVKARKGDSRPWNRNWS